MSSDQGVTFVRVDGQKVSGGGPFSCYAMTADPKGTAKLAVFNMSKKPGPVRLFARRRENLGEFHVGGPQLGLRRDRLAEQGRLGCVL